MKTKIEKAGRVLTKAIKNDDELFLNYRANIAEAFMIEYGKKPTRNIREIANIAASNFLNMWIRGFEI